MNLREWKATTLKNYIEKHHPAKEEVDHVMDYLGRHPALRLKRLSYPQAVIKAEKWTQALNKKNKDLKESGQVKIIKEWPEFKLKMVLLKDQVAKNWEGKHMGHCVASYTKHKGIYSLRDENDIPHATLEVKVGCVEQIQGKANRELVEKYVPFVFEFVAAKKWSIDNDYAKRLGLKKVYSNVAWALDYHFFGVSVIQKNFEYKWVKTSSLKPRREVMFSHEFEKKTWLGKKKVSLDFNEMHEVLEVLVLTDQFEILDFIAKNFSEEGSGKWIQIQRDFPRAFHNSLDKLIKEASKSKDFSKVEAFIKTFKLGSTCLSPILCKAVLEVNKPTIKFLQSQGAKITRNNSSSHNLRFDFYKEQEQIIKTYTFSPEQLEVLLNLEDSEVFILLLSRFSKEEDLLRFKLVSESIIKKDEHTRKPIMREWIATLPYLGFSRSSEAFMEIVYPLLRSTFDFATTWSYLSKRCILRLVETNEEFRAGFMETEGYRVFNPEEQIALAQKYKFPQSQLDLLMEAYAERGDLDRVKVLHALGAKLDNACKVFLEKRIEHELEILNLTKT